MHSYITFMHTVRVSISIDNNNSYYLITRNLKYSNYKITHKENNNICVNIYFLATSTSKFLEILVTVTFAKENWGSPVASIPCCGSRRCPNGVPAPRSAKCPSRIPSPGYANCLGMQSPSADPCPTVASSGAARCPGQAKCPRVPSRTPVSQGLRETSEMAEKSRRVLSPGAAKCPAVFLLQSWYASRFDPR